ncbi:fibroblast growth factor receptor-like 1 [Gigantopelta aegis]|uniref:fibroblast growth factor receptor-like 1 n=1 Tax=Gigantopelta aegis TaxID=1735272 RepID=UPI001B88BC98|nr:fibroblast growth factor receptor-like 1 [Gigantopelta aegis]
MDPWWILLFVSLTSVSTASGPPKISGKIHSRHIAYVGKNTKLLCPVLADPLPMMQWRKDGRTIHSGWTRFKVSQDGQLRIKEVEMDDAGTYLCKATNGFGHVNVNYTLIVVDDKNGIVKEDNNLYPKTPEEDLRKEGAPPEFTDYEKMKKSDIMRPVGSSVRLKCRALGNPRPHIIWFKDDMLLEDVVDALRPHWILKLHNLQDADSGDYTCRVSNRLGSINHTYSLEVVERIQSKPVLIPPYPKNTSIEYGQTASFQCHVKSVVQPHIQWLKRVEDPDSVYSVNTTIEVKGQKFVVLKTGEVWTRPDGSYLNKLVIQRVTERHSGMYICLGANSRGYNFRSAYLSIKQPSHMGAPYSNKGSSSDSAQSNLPLFIGVPAVIVLIVVIIAIVILQRRRRCNATARGLKVQRIAVPTHDKDFYPNYHNSNILQTSREKIPKMSTQSLDFYSDNISSVSRSQQHSHQHMYSY